MKESWFTEIMATSGVVSELCELREACNEGRGVISLRITNRKVPEHIRVCVACADAALARYDNIEAVGAKARERDKQIRESRQWTRSEIEDILLVAAADPKGCKFAEVRDAHGFSDADGRRVVLDLESKGLLYREPDMARLRDATLHYPDEF
jgi:hypothetical protein